jgi:PPK2 family polyphosphate:nucleotide phosphotransferase
MSVMKKYRVEPGKKLRLSKYDPDDTSGVRGGKAKGKEELVSLSAKLDELQELLYANHDRKLLIVLQGMDTSGKDGTIRHVFDSVDPLGVRVESFKVPTSDELDRDFLWRVHMKVPRRGEIVIFNRSHYEDVLVVRVHNIVPEKIWRARYDQINAFEKLLADSGTTIVKFFLHIDRDEQKKRLQARLDDEKKQWKFAKGDLAERALWDDYTKAYEEALQRTSTESAPWYVVPSNPKWYRNHVIASVLIETLKGMKLKAPEPEEDLASVVIE